MSDPKIRSHGTQPPPPRPRQQNPSGAGGHPLPRRTTPEKSITLRHHRRARDATIRTNLASANRGNVESAGPPPVRRNSSGDSHDTGNSDAKKWFDQSNRNPSATFGGQAMEVDPPFFQKESDSSNDSGPKAAFRFDINAGQAAGPKPKNTHSSADDYRSVIDDLTVEIQRLKDELKRYKQLGPESLKKEKLFEIKVHGLPKRKRLELEATLRDFAASLDGTTTSNSTSQRQKSSRVMYSDRSMSKHASSCSGSHSRPVDSAYASMSTGNNSSGRSLSRPSMSSRLRSADLKVESYLKDIPEGLYPRHMTLTDKEKKKLVVRRLEQLFTGKISGRDPHQQQHSQGTGGYLAPVVTKPQQSVGTVPPPLPNPGPHPGPSREARILPHDTSNKKPQSRDNGSTSNSNGDQTESGGTGGNGGNTSSGANVTPPIAPLPEQRPTRPRDLDPDRVQIPSENMEYIRHLGLLPPELIADKKAAEKHHVSPDADGWVYLNLLCNLAQLHMINVTPGFIRGAVSEKSTKFQLSPDGRKIRWRGGSEGTKFSSDSSGDNSQTSPSTDDTDSSNKEISRKRTKTKHLPDDNSASSSKNRKFDPHMPGSEHDSFHYKPLFIHHTPSNEQTSQDDTWSSFGPGENSDPSGWRQSRSGSSQRRKRRLDGAIIYYSGAPFCTDLSGDPGDLSPTTYPDSSGQGLSSRTRGTLANPQGIRPPLGRSESGSMLHFRPLSQKTPANFEMNIEPSGSLQGLVRDCVGDSGGDDEELEADFSWSSARQNQQVVRVLPLEPSGLGGVRPEDHFVVVVATKRPKTDDGEQAASPPNLLRKTSEETADSIVRQLATMTARSSQAPRRPKPIAIEIEYLTGRIKRLAPVPLPPPAVFFPPFSTDGSSNSVDLGSEADDDLISSSELTSRRVNPHQSVNTYPDNVELSSEDEEGDEFEDDAAMNVVCDGDEGDSDEALDLRPPVGPALSGPPGHGSSAATAGGRESGYSSTEERTS